MADRLGTPLTLKWTDIVILLFFRSSATVKDTMRGDRK